MEITSEALATALRAVPMTVRTSDIAPDGDGFGTVRAASPEMYATILLDFIALAVTPDEATTDGKDRS